MTVPSATYFPGGLQDRAAWFQNLATKFPGVAIVPLGFTAARVSAVIADNEDFQFLASATVDLDTFVSAFRLYRKGLTEGNIGEPTPNYPANPSLNPPAQVATGIFERLDDLVKQIRVASAYTEEIGALLGIIPSQSGGPQIPEEDLQPSLKTVSLPGSIVQVKFVRGNTNGVVIETKVDNSASWSEVGKFNYSPATLVIPANTQNLPHSVQVRARYVDKDTPVGQFSDIVTTATQPAG